MEILRQHSGPLHAVFVPVGGGGLLCGCGLLSQISAPRNSPDRSGAEDAACLKAMDANTVSCLASRRCRRRGSGAIGQETYRLIRELVDDVITVTTDEICAAIMDVYDDTCAITEPAGAPRARRTQKYVHKGKASPIKRWSLSIVAPTSTF